MAVMADTISKQIIDKLQSFDSVVTDGCVVTGGHFMMSDGRPQLNAGTELSFRVAADIVGKSAQTKTEVGLGILFNNIGATCGTDSCQIGAAVSDFVLPEEFAEAMNLRGLETTRLEVFLEKHMRNRGKKEFGRRVKHLENVSEDDEGWWLEDSGRKYLLTRRSALDHYGTPACPLIMAAYAMEQQRRGYTSSLNFWYIDPKNFENIPNHFNIEKGHELARVYGAGIRVMNVYFTDDKVLTNF